MKRNILEIEIEAPIEKVFEFTIEPSNTHLWASVAGEETVDAYPIRLGTIYSNDFSKLVVSEFIHNEVFELSEVDGAYKVKYTYTPTDSGTLLTYDERMEDGSNLSEPFAFSNLETLKKLIEN